MVENDSCEFIQDFCKTEIVYWEIKHGVINFKNLDKRY